METNEKEQRAKHIGDYFAKHETGTALAHTLEYVFNHFGSDSMAKETADYICTYTHKTIQQCIMRGILIFLRRMAKVENYDARNEASVKMAQVAIKAIDDANIGLPFI